MIQSVRLILMPAWRVRLRSFSWGVAKTRCRRSSVVLFRALPNVELSIFSNAGHGGIFQYHREFTDQALRLIPCR